MPLALLEQKLMSGLKENKNNHITKASQHEKLFLLNKEIEWKSPNLRFIVIIVLRP
jgi:hypothetical protein